MPLIISNFNEIMFVEIQILFLSKVMSVRSIFTCLSLSIKASPFLLPQHLFFSSSSSQFMYIQKNTGDCPLNSTPLIFVDCNYQAFSMFFSSQSSRFHALTSVFCVSRYLCKYKGIWVQDLLRLSHVGCCIPGMPIYLPPATWHLLETLHLPVIFPISSLPKGGSI